VSSSAVSSLRGKWALVTGSSRGIGQQIALGLAEFDCNIVVHGRTKRNTARTRRLLADFDVGSVVVAGDLGTAAGVRSVLRAVAALPEPVDILYNNAGVQNAWRPLWEIDRSTWQSTFDVNLFAVIELTNVLAPGMLASGMPMELVERPHPDWTLARLIQGFYGTPLDTGFLEAAKGLDRLGAEWRRAMEARLASATVERWQGRLYGPL